jgi:hypothetical protein
MRLHRRLLLHRVAIFPTVVAESLIHRLDLESDIESMNTYETEQRSKPQIPSHLPQGLLAPKVNSF